MGKIEYKIKVCILTTTRAEYGLLAPLIDELNADMFWEISLIVAGTHMSESYGYTYREINNNGHNIAKMIDLNIDGDTPNDCTRYIAEEMMEINKLLDNLSPNLAIILGDRYELMGFVLPTFLRRIPIAHINGGETTKGALDDDIRNAITKLSKYHFTANEKYKEKVISLGEPEQNVFNVGGLGVDVINSMILLNKVEIESKIKVKLDKPILLVTFHPETNSDLEPQSQIEELLVALEHYTDHIIIFTGANADPGGSIINRMVRNFADNTKNRYIFSSLGSKLYLSLMKLSSAVIGNSSSGLAEAPTLKVPTVNVGKRQEGRLRADSVIDCEINSLSIVKAIEKSLSSEFVDITRSSLNPYGTGKTAKKIVDILKRIYS
tara:strand:+ start:1169 stop:2305 length:1137 start_codon:yes stop_codon:yes gene_type:complete